MSDFSLTSSSTTILIKKSHKIYPFFKNLPPFFKYKIPFNLKLQNITSNKPIFSSLSENGTSSTPIYVPTPPDRELRSPHSGSKTTSFITTSSNKVRLRTFYPPKPVYGSHLTLSYHFDGSTRQFFEGWYFKVSIPEKRQSFCFMYSVENPAFRKKLTTIEETKYGSRFTGVGAQILGADDKYICQFMDESQNFWGSRHELMLGNTFKSSGSSQPPTREVPPEEFNRRVSEGFQVTPLWHQGFICDDGRSDYVETVKTARWEYSTCPVYGWGNVTSKQKSTAGWLAAFPVFEPHWQICMAGGLSTGWIEWDGERFEFENAPSYSEKNWGAGFPKKWFWVQCNVFEGAMGEVALTAAGGLRELPGGRIENATLVGVHYAGVFYEFVPWNGSVEWDIAPWGCWKISADNGSYKVELEATTEDPGTPLRAPTPEYGLAVACKDTCFGVLKLQLWERKSDGSNGKVILEVTSNMAALEVGGGPWFKAWKGSTTTPEALSTALRVPLDMESIFGFIPVLKPPGL